jgi:hypothetical protein
MDIKHQRGSFLDGWAESSNGKNDEKNWKKLWKVKVPSKICKFAWRLAPSSFPMGEFRERRHMATTTVYNVTTDTWRHSLLDPRGMQLCKANWTPPRARVLKINIDGAVAKLTNYGAISAVCCDDQGQFIGCSSVRLNGITNPAVLEALACSEAMSLAVNLQARRSLIALDCLNVVKKILFI